MWCYGFAPSLERLPTGIQIRNVPYFPSICQNKHLILCFSWSLRFSQIEKVIKWWNVPVPSDLLPWSHSSLPQDDFWPVRMLRWRFFIALILCPFSKILFLTPLIHLFCHGKRPLFLPCRALIPCFRWRIDLFNYWRSSHISIVLCPILLPIESHLSRPILRRPFLRPKMWF